MTVESIYYEAAWVLALFGATAVLREAFGELCVHYVANRLFHRASVRGGELDVLLSASNGGRSLGFAAAWRLRPLYGGDARLRLACFAPLLCWLVGMPVKLIAVTAVRENAVRFYLSPGLTWAIGISWIVFAVVVKAVAIGLAARPKNPRALFQKRLARFAALVELLNPELAKEARDSDTEVGLAVSFDSTGLQLQPVVIP